MKITAGVYTLALVALLGAAPPAAPQTTGTDLKALRATIDRRFDLLPVRDGFVLRPKNSARGIRSIEITRGPVALDGQPATGAELRDKLGEDADLILQLSYLSDEQRQTLLGESVAGGSASGALEPSPRSERRAAIDRAIRRSRDRSNDDRVHIGGSVSVRAGEVVDGNVVAVGGSANIDGEVHGDVVAIGGGVTLGPNAIVSNNVVVIGGTLHRDPAARVEGQVQEIEWKIGLGGFDLSRLQWNTPLRFSAGSMFGSAFALVGTLTRLAVLCLMAALVVLIARPYAERAGDHAAMNPLKSGAIGFLAEILFVPVLIITIVVLCMTIVGIPLLLLLPFAMLALAVAGLVGFTGVANRLGHVIAERLGWGRDNEYLTTTLGIVAVLSPTILARFIGVMSGGLLLPVTLPLGILGYLIEYLAWTIGFGAVALARFNRVSNAGPAVMLHSEV